MALTGGASAKLGAFYEGRRTVLSMMEVLEGSASSIRLEPPGAEGRGIEFWLRAVGSTEYYQIKRQRSSSGRWSIADLVREGVLTAFLEKLEGDPEAYCVFVSTDSANELRELAERAGRQILGMNSSESFSAEVECRRASKDFRLLGTFPTNEHLPIFAAFAWKAVTKGA